MSRLFWAQMALAFQGPPLQTASLWISSHPNQYVQPHIKNRYIGNFMDKRFQGPFRDGLMFVYPVGGEGGMYKIFVFLA
jgi:hypothetical protein